jgi:hypothetical protein
LFVIFFIPIEGNGFKPSSENEFASHKVRGDAMAGRKKKKKQREKRVKEETPDKHVEGHEEPEEEEGTENYADTDEGEYFYR